MAQALSMQQIDSHLADCIRRHADQRVDELVAKTSRWVDVEDDDGSGFIVTLSEYHVFSFKHSADELGIELTKGIGEALEGRAS